MPNPRSVGQPRGVSAQQHGQSQQQTKQQQDDLFSSSSQLSSSGAGFRFGNQNAVGQAARPQEGGGDEFPPLSSGLNGEIGQDRNLSMLQNGGFGGPQGYGGGLSSPPNTQSNGLLNALSSSNGRGSISQRESQNLSVGGKWLRDKVKGEVSGANCELPGPSSARPSESSPTTGRENEAIVCLSSHNDTFTVSCCISSE
jgi:hypothetical protein